MKPKEIKVLKKELKNKPLLKNENLIIKNLKKLLFNSIKKTKGKIGIAFSGGIDSTLIAFICKELKKDFILYSIGLKNSKDLIQSKKVAKTLKFKLKYKQINQKEAEETIKKVTKLIPNPDSTKVTVGSVLYEVLKLAKKDNITLLLTGLGSEEIFAGYERHKKNTQEACWLGLETIYERDLIRDLTISKFFKTKLYCPFLDKSLVKYTMQISPKLKIKNNIKKYILRKLALSLGIKKEISFLPKRAAQYGSNFDKFLGKLTKKSNLKYKKNYISLIKKGPRGI